MAAEKPEMCCTCANWHPFKDDFMEGVCKKALESRAFDDTCEDWEDCDGENDQEASNLGYD